MSADHSEQTAAVPAPLPVEADEFPHKVFVGNIAFATTEEKLHEFFAPAGNVLQAKVITRGTRSLGYGFVAFESLEECSSAVEKLSKKELDGREINVEVAKPKSHEPKARKPRKRRGKKSGDAADSEDGEIITYAEANASAESKKEGKGQRKPRAKRASADAAPTAGASGDGDEAAKTKGRRQRKPRPARPLRKLGEPSKTTVFIANLPFGMDDAGLTALFTDYKVKNASVVMHRANPRSDRAPRSKGFGFVEFETEEEQQRLVNSDVKLVAEERELNIKVALTELRTETEETSEVSAVAAE